MNLVSFSLNNNNNNSQALKVKNIFETFILPISQVFGTPDEMRGRIIQNA